MTPKVHCHFHKSQPLVHILKQMDTIHILLFLQVALISSHLLLGLADYLPTSGFLQKLCIPLYFATRVTLPAKFILDLNILIMCSEGHRSWSFTFCIFSCLLIHFRFTTILCFFLIYFFYHFLQFFSYGTLHLFYCFIFLLTFGLVLVSYSILQLQGRQHLVIPAFDCITRLINRKIML